jgi:hypothetical protein
VRLALVLAVVVVLAVVALALATYGPERAASPPPTLSTGELRTRDLESSIAVVVHLNYGDTAYGRQAEVLSRLRELGVRHLRDAMPAPGLALASGLKAASAQGIRATLGTGNLDTPPAIAVAQSLQVLPKTAVDAFEGPNEYDGSGDPGWATRLRSYMPQLATAVRRQAPGAAVVQPSLLYPGNRAQLPIDLPGIFNLHPYPGGGPPEPVIAAALRELPVSAKRRGVVFTETGYQNALRATTGQPPASEAAAAVYLPRLLVTAFGTGVRRTFIYELLDERADPGLTDPEQHFGLLRDDLSPKPGFNAVRTLLAALRASPGAGAPAPLRWTLEGPGAPSVERLTLARDDGSHVIALWRPVTVWDHQARRPVAVDRLPVTVHLARPATEVEVWRPSLATRPVLRRGDVQSLRLALGGDLVLVSVD